MKPEIASLRERMSRGGDWKAFRDEIAALHTVAVTEEEYVTLLEAHTQLVAVGKLSFDEGTYQKLLPIAAGEYRMFLNKEAMEGDSINPRLLARVTRREIEAGRLEPDDSLRNLAVAGASVLGDPAELTAHACRNGNWFFYGMAVAGILSAGLSHVPLSPFWLIAIGLLAGWWLNERERKRIKVAIAARRAHLAE